MFGFGKKKTNKPIDTTATENAAAQIDEKELQKLEEKMPSGMKETAQRMMSGQFDMNDMLAQLKQIKKMSNFSGLLKCTNQNTGGHDPSRTCGTRKNFCQCKNTYCGNRWVHCARCGTYYQTIY